MIAVKFNRSMAPYGRGDIAYLPDDVARRIMDDGDAVQYMLPQNPHASSPIPQEIQDNPDPPKRKPQKYLTK